MADFFDFGEFFEAIGGAEGERETFAAELGDLDADEPADLSAIEWEQWEALLTEYVETGQLTEEQLGELREVYGDLDDFEGFLWEVEYDAPAGTAYEETA